MPVKKNIFFILFLLTSMYISSQDEVSPVLYPPGPTVIFEDISLFYIGKDISNYNVNKRNQYLVTNSQFWPYFMVYFDGTYYTIAFDNDNKIRAIYVIDTSIRFNHQQSFRIPEGVYAGMKYSDLKNIEPNISLTKMPGWGYRGVLSSGWKVAFFIGETATERFPEDDDNIGSIFKD